MLETREATLKYLAAIIVVAVIVGVYWPGLHGGFLLDDFPNLVNNKAVHVAHLTLSNLAAAAMSSGSGPLHRPLSMLSFALDYYFFHGTAFSYKATNLAIHILNCIIVFFLAKEIIVSYCMAYKKLIEKQKILWLSLFIALVWGVNPIQLTAVLYTVQRMTSLSALFSFSAILCYLTLRRKIYEQDSGITSYILFWIAPISLCIMSVLSKENGALSLLLMAAMELFIFKFRNSDASDYNSRIFFALFCILPSLLAVLLIVTKPGLYLSYASRDFTLGERLLTETRAVCAYLVWMIVPNTRALGLYHDDFGVSTSLTSPLTTLLSIVILVGLTLGALFLRRSKPVLALGLFWFLIGQSMESSIFPLELVYEHRNYLPSFGIALAIIAGLGVDWNEKTARAMAVVGLAYASLLASTTWLRAEQWRDNLTQAYYAAQHHPKSARAVDELGRQYANLAIKGHLEYTGKAIETLKRATRLDKRSILPDVTLAMAALKLGKPLPAGWIRLAESKLRMHRLTLADTDALNALVMCPPTQCLISNSLLGGILDAALNSPGFDTLHKTRADMLTIYGNFLTNHKGDLRGAENAMLQAAAAAPNLAQYHINAARVAIALADFKTASRELDRLKRLNHFDALTDSIDRLSKRLASAKKYVADHPREKNG